MKNQQSVDPNALSCYKSGIMYSNGIIFMYLTLACSLMRHIVTKKNYHNDNNHMQIIPNNQAFLVAFVLFCFFKRANMDRSYCYMP